LVKKGVEENARELEEGKLEFTMGPPGGKKISWPGRKTES